MKRGRKADGGICAPYRERIMELVEQGFTLKYVWEQLEKEGLYISYEAFTNYCKKKGIQPNMTRVCDNCKHDAVYPVIGNMKTIRICMVHKQGHHSKTVPRFCKGGFERKE